MSDPFIAEIRMFAGNYAPMNWAMCTGAILSISQNTALFSLLGTNYGGNGTTNFALPNFVGTVPLGAGAGDGLSPYGVGETVGANTVTLGINEMPMHSHQLQANFNVGDLKAPTNRTCIARSNPGNVYAPDTGNAFEKMDPSALSPFQGGSLPHNNIQPYIAVSFIIALAGIFPPRQ